MGSLFKKSPLRFAKRLLINQHGRIRWLIPDKYFICSVPGGRIYLNLKESSMMLERCFGLYEPEKTRAIRTLVKPGQTFIDVGGNKGDFALLAAKIVGPSGRVICIEPEPTNFGWIERSVALNGYKNVQLCQIALSNRDGESLLHLGTTSGSHSLLNGAPGRGQGSLKVKMRTLDGLLAELGVRSVNVMKIDVEGAELQVLQGAAETIRNNPQLILLMDLHPAMGVDVAEVFDFLKSLGLVACQMRPPYNVPAVPHAEIYDVVAARA